MKGWRPITSPKDVVTRETIGVQEPLPVEYQTALDRIRKDTPSEFKDQARKAAYYLWSLDSGRDLSDENGVSLQSEVDQFVKQIATTGFVNSTYVRATHKALWKDDEAVEPGRVLPKWLAGKDILIETPLGKAKSLDRIKTFEDFYEKYTDSFGNKYEATHGEYTKYDRNTPPKNMGELKINNFKFYIESESLGDTINLEKALNRLSEMGLHPHESKLFEDFRLVLYWHTGPNDKLVAEIRKTFVANGLTARGPGQDTIEIKIDKTGSHKSIVRFSNDASLGSHNIYAWKGISYNPQEFFSQYLRLCFQGGKNPTEPYKQSFVPIITEGQVENEESIGKLRQKISEEANLPIFVSDHPHLTVFEDER